MAEHNKLVRDRIPEICEANGATPIIRVLTTEEYIKALGDKMLEEAHEVQADQNVEELADVLEVIMAIAKAHGITMEEIESVRAKKAEERGGFDKHIFLIRTEDKK